MGENEQTKTCPLCAETIKAAAKVCPYCRKIQMRGLFITRYDLAGMGALIAFIAASFLTFNKFADGRNFEASKDQVKVLNSQLTINREKECTNVFVSGILTNQSDFAWRLGNFEVRFFDASGKTIDTVPVRDGFVVLPHSDHAFSLNLYGVRNFGATNKVSILSAADPNVWFSYEYY